MPMYEYECQSCSTIEEQFSRISYNNSIDRYCDGCGGLMTKIISKPSRILIAGWDTVVGHDGTVLSRKQSTETIPIVPEKVHGSRW